MSTIKEIAAKLREIEAGRTDGDTLGSIADELEAAEEKEDSQHGY